MKRLLNIMKWDMIFQMNYKLYPVGVVITVVWIAILAILPGEIMEYALPIILLADLSTMGLMFIGAILFFEKGQGSIHAVIVTPMKTSDYLLSKVITLCAYIVLISTIVVVATAFIKGLTVNYLFVILATVLTSVAYTFGGFLLSSRYKKFTDFFLPMALVFGFFNIPLIWMFDVESVEAFRALIYVIPSHGLIILLQSMFEPQPWYDIAYAVVYNSFVIFVLYKLCIKSFNKKVIGRSSDIDG